MMRRTFTLGRVAAGLFLLLLLFPVLPWLARAMGMGPLLFADLFLRAWPLYVAWLIDSSLLDGGEVGPELWPLHALLAVLLYAPVFLLALRPELWRVKRWRRILIGYSFVAAFGTVLAAGWVFTHLGIFF